MKKILVYPYNEDFTAIVRNRTQNTVDSEFYLIAPKGSVKIKKDASFVDGLEQTGIYVTDDILSVISIVDEFWLIENDFIISFEKYLELIMQINEFKKKIVILKKFTKNEKEEITAINKGIEFTESKNLIKNSITYALSVPIIAVAGLGENTSKFDIQLMISKELSERHYKISHIGTKPYCEAFDFHSFPEKIFEEPIKDSEQIRNFRLFIQNICEEENPDIILLGIPLGILPLNDYVQNEYGTIMFKITNAISIDFLILSLYYEEYYNEKYIIEIQNLLKYRFNTELNVLSLNNVKVCWNSLKESKNDDNAYMRIPYEKLTATCENYQKNSLDIKNLLDKKTMSLVIDDIISELKYNAKINVF